MARPKFKRFRAEASKVIVGMFHVYDFAAGRLASDLGRPAYFRTMAEAKAFADRHNAEHEAKEAR